MARSGSSRGFPCQIPERPSARCRCSPRTSLPRSASAVGNTLDAATRERTMAGGARERTAGAGGSGGLMQAFLAGDGGGGLLRGGTGAARGSQAYLGPRARAAPGDKMIDWASSRLRGGCGRSVYSGRPPGPARQDRERLTADWRELAAVMPHRVSSAPARCLAGRARMATRGAGFRRRTTRRRRARPGCGRPAGGSCGPRTGRRACRPDGPSPGRSRRGRGPRSGRGSCRPHRPPSAAPAVPAGTAARAGPCGPKTTR